MAESNDYFGFELLNKLVDNQLCKKEDIVVLFGHWFLVKNGFKCIGLGDAKTIDGTEQGSEFLPEGWNRQEHYTLRYLKEGQLYILLGRKSDDNLLLNFMRVSDSCVSNVKFHIESTVNNIHGALPALLPNCQQVMNKIHQELVEPVYTGNARETSTQTYTDGLRDLPPPDTGHDPLRVGPPHRPQQPLPPWNPIADPRGIGRRDLDPFAGIDPQAGGMIFDPFGPGRAAHRLDPQRPGGLGGPARLPPGAIPPGARFDPFGPPDLNRPRPSPRNPDHDHLPPPGYDDMFM